MAQGIAAQAGPTCNHSGGHTSAAEWHLSEANKHIAAARWHNDKALARRKRHADNVAAHLAGARDRLAARWRAEGADRHTAEVSAQAARHSKADRQARKARQAAQAADRSAELSAQAADRAADILAGGKS